MFSVFDLQSNMTGYQDKKTLAPSTGCIALPIGGIGGRLPDFISVFAPLSSLKSEDRLKKSHSLAVCSSLYSKKLHFLMVCEVSTCTCVSVTLVSVHGQISQVCVWVLV